MSATLGALIRETGQHEPERYADAMSYARAYSLVDAKREIFSSHAGPITCLALEPIHERLLLAADTRSAVSLYDCDAGSPAPASDRAGAKQGRGEKLVARHAPGTATSSSAVVAGHTKAISVAAWYPVDSGIFLTAGMDAAVVAWDARRFTPAYRFPMDGKVYALACSPVASLHSLVAAGAEDPRVRLMDLATCGNTHTLIGHRDGILALAWHPAHEFMLASGSKDGTIRLWDVRRSGSTAQLAVFDQHTHQSAVQKAASSSGAGGGLAGPRAGAAAAAAAAAAEASASGAGSTSNPSPAYGGSAAVSHSQGVNGLLFLPPADGGPQLLLSTGLDSAVRAWAIMPQAGGSGSSTSSGSTPAVTDEAELLTGKALAPVRVWNTLRSYPGVINRRKRGVHMTSARISFGGTTAAYVFHPNSGTADCRNIRVYDVESGQPAGVLVGHAGNVNAVVYRHAAQELWSAGEDALLLRWKPRIVPGGGELQGADTTEADGGEFPSASGDAMDDEEDEVVFVPS